MLTSTIIAIIVYTLSIILIPLIMILIPSDYFTHPKRQRFLWQKFPPVLQWAVIIIKNLLGVLLIVTGIAMLFLPGQGILTIIAGLMFVNFPCKYKVEKWIIQQPIVFHAINKIRQKAGKTPLKIKK
ncbi:hypothetical protein PGH07_06620 [Sulfurovum sp. zt1-1]|uniref:Transmembrane protein (PGPGW) n=1 Tax=Sulfurovum zhangzhouensis TaxID=3019067 RepID=A0ABT7QYC3_9BACT|nr:PGPGW domain-containing protein [Sulfurovum zhangzhouensis]MDM5271845.1 hypothetical protein [Sulfurovum zhangzhouensis]